MITETRAPIQARTVAPGAASWHLPPTETAPASARQTLRTQLALWHLEPLLDEARLVVSELVTNAAQHGVGAIPMKLQLIVLSDGSEQLLVEFHDHGGGLGTVPERHYPTCGLSERGRGLGLVSRIASSWGDAPDADGHTIWACLALTRESIDDEEPHACPACRVNHQPSAPAIERDAHAS
ncbi:ATP-binding protein [Streptomyces sp. NPDC002262]|uniref:ATP-binding protein n=1 Tax=Streptomyces sp. NPDC002262 TaxID=3154414 RepID=UPI00331F1AB5